MADSITSCIGFYWDDGSIDHYEVDFTSDVGDPIPTVRVRPVEMTNPTDLAELKRLASAKASSIKKFQTQVPTGVEINDILGPVTL